MDFYIDQAKVFEFLRKLDYLQDLYDNLIYGAVASELNQTLHMGLSSLDVASKFPSLHTRFGDIALLFDGLGLVDPERSARIEVLERHFDEHYAVRYLLAWRELDKLRRFLMRLGSSVQVGLGAGSGFRCLTNKFDFDFLLLRRVAVAFNVVFDLASVIDQSRIDGDLFVLDFGLFDLLLLHRLNFCCFGEHFSDQEALVLYLKDKFDVLDADFYSVLWWLHKYLFGWSLDRVRRYLTYFDVDLIAIESVLNFEVFDRFIESVVRRGGIGFAEPERFVGVPELLSLDQDIVAWGKRLALGGLGVGLAYNLLFDVKQRLERDGYFVVGVTDFKLIVVGDRSAFLDNSVLEFAEVVDFGSNSVEFRF